MGETIEIGATGAKKVLKSFTPESAISEYIKNGFDAGAKTVTVNIELNKIGLLPEITIVDDGSGIDFEHLSNKFKPFYESDKGEEEYESHSSKCFGRNGLGRLTFFTFAHNAEWNTTYKSSQTSKKYQYQIKIGSGDLNKYEYSDKKEVTGKTGTIVKFTGFQKEMNSKEKVDSILEYLRVEFCWFLELNKKNNYSVILNGKKLTYDDNVISRKKYNINIDQTLFDVQLISWRKLNKSEMSKIYYLSESEEEKYKEYTQLNRKGDNFHHSVFVKSPYFDNFAFESSENQSVLGLKGKSDKLYKDFSIKLKEFMLKERRPILKKNSAEFFSKQYEQTGILTTKGKTGIEKIQTQTVKRAIEEIWQIEPKIFTGLNTEQKKVMAKFLGLFLESDEREKLISVIEQIVDLEPAQRKELYSVLGNAKLSHIIKMSNLIIDRFRKVELLKELLFRPDLTTKEVEHLQPLIEEMTWLFGEQYAIFGRQDDNIEKILRTYRKNLGDFSEIEPMDDANKRKEIDLFLCRKELTNTKVNNLIIELKRPSVKLGKSQADQINSYMMTILNENQFNNISNSTWTFILVGNDFDGSGHIDAHIENSKIKGIPGLIMENKNYKIIVKKWSEILTDFEIRHKFLQEQLKLSKDKLIQEFSSAGEIVDAAFSGYEAKSA